MKMIKKKFRSSRGENEKSFSNRLALHIGLASDSRAQARYASPNAIASGFLPLLKMNEREW